MIRLRVRFAKRGKVRFTSHRDVARLWERALRKAGVDVAYSEGFSPRPKLSFGLALSTGHESEAEYLEIRLAEGPRTDTDLADLDSLGRRLDEALPAGIDVLAVAASDQKNDSLQQAVTACTWRFDVDDGWPTCWPPTRSLSNENARARWSARTSDTRCSRSTSSGPRRPESGLKPNSAPNPEHYAPRSCWRLRIRHCGRAMCAGCTNGCCRATNASNHWRSMPALPRSRTKRA